MLVVCFYWLSRSQSRSKTTSKNNTVTESSFTPLVGSASAQSGLVGLAGHGSANGGTETVGQVAEQATQVTQGVQQVNTSELEQQHFRLAGSRMQREK